MKILSQQRIVKEVNLPEFRPNISTFRTPLHMRILAQCKSYRISNHHVDADLHKPNFLNNESLT